MDESERSSKIYSADEIAEKIKPVMIANHISEAYLFGSYARKEALGSSDIDLLINVQDPDFSLLDKSRVRLELVQALEKEVDIYILDGLSYASYDFREELRKDIVPLYIADKELAPA